MEVSGWKRIFSFPKNLPFIRHSLGAVFVRAVCSVAMNKWVAVCFGPAGTALFSQFINLFGAFTVVANDGLARAMVKEGAHFHQVENEAKLSKTIFSAFGLMVAVFLLQGILLAGLGHFTGWMEPFHSSGIWWFLVFGFVALAATFFFSNLFLIRAQTNLQAMMVTSVSVGALIGLVLSTIVGLSILPCLIGLTAGQVLVGLLFFFLNFRKLEIRFSLAGWDSALARKMLVFTFAIASTAVLSRFAEYGIVNWALGFHGTKPVGIWLAMHRLADSVNIPILAVTNGILLPLLSANAGQVQALRELLRPIFRQTLILTAIGFFVAFLVYPLLMNLLFSDQFVALKPWISWQIVGDFFKSNAFLISILSLAVGATRFFFWLEVFSIFLYISLSTGLSHLFGIEGIFIAHAIRFGLYWLCLFVKFNKVLL